MLVPLCRQSFPRARRLDRDGRSGPSRGAQLLATLRGPASLSVLRRSSRLPRSQQWPRSIVPWRRLLRTVLLVAPCAPRSLCRHGLLHHEQVHRPHRCLAAEPLAVAVLRRGHDRQLLGSAGVSLQSRARSCGGSRVQHVLAASGLRRRLACRVQGSHLAPPRAAVVVHHGLPYGAYDRPGSARHTRRCLWDFGEDSHLAGVLRSAVRAAHARSTTGCLRGCTRPRLALDAVRGVPLCRVDRVARAPGQIWRAARRQRTRCSRHLPRQLHGRDGRRPEQPPLSSAAGWKLLRVLLGWCLLWAAAL
mmetsp:Transcript_52714/g.171420  ORF Transcript_52714/g.171420 Transcript_52714/m.171420 type:complete len:305 (+) Transcript_52714:731-1645(+)